MASRKATAFRWRAFIGVVLLVGGLCAAAILMRPSSIEDVEARTWDWRLRTIVRPPVNTPIRIINIDQASLDHLEQHEHQVWVWPRGIYVPILNYLKRAGAKAVAFDIVFFEQSSWGVEDDNDFAQAVGASLPVVTAVTLRREETAETDANKNLFMRRQRENAALVSRVQVPEHAVEKFRGVSLPVTQLLERSAAFGDVEGAPDADGIFRHIAVMGSNDLGGAFRTLKLPFALLMLADPAYRLDLSRYVDRDGRIPLRFLGPKGSIPTESFANIFISWQNIEAGVAPLIPFENYKDSLVFVGMDAPGLLDLRPTPLSPNFPGVELNATVLQNALDNSFIRKLDIGPAAVLTVLMVALLAAITLFLSGKVQAVVTVAAGAGYWAISVWCADAGWWIPLAVPSTGMVSSLLLCLVTQYVIEGRQHRFIRGAFRHYVSPSVIDRIVEDPKQLQLGGEKRELTIFFSDIQGFTTISEGLEANRLVPLLNLYLTAVTDIIMRHGGTVDKYVGDAVVAFWNAPISIPDHAMRGVEAALEIQDALTRLAPEFQKDFGVVVKTRIGLNSGPVSVGNFGSASRFNYTVIGDAANLASRLEGANKAFGTRIMFAERTFDLLEGKKLCRRIGSLKVVGKNQGVNVYEPLTQDHLLMAPELRAGYELALVAFEAGNLEAARQGFAGLKGDPVSEAYLARIEKELKKGLDQFSPQWNLTEK